MATKPKAKVVGLYEAGRPSPYHMAPPSSVSQDAELANANPTLRDWSRHLAANSSVVTAVLDSRVANGIGTGLVYEPLVRDRQGNLLTEFNAQIRRLLDRWRRMPDVTGELSGGELERLLWRAWDTDGEVFVRQVILRDQRAVLPYRVQVVESDLVPFSWVTDARQVIHGVEKDDWGRPVRYHIYRRRPQDMYSNMRAATLVGELTAVPADAVHHLKRVKRPDQTRGLPLVHSVIFRVADIAEYAQSHRLAARASADLFASINRAPDWQPTKQEDGTENPARDWQFEHLQILDNLAAGESVNFHAPSHPNQNAPEFLHEELRQIAAGTRTAFSQIAMVFDASYAAQRLEIVQAWRYIEQDRAQFVSDVALPALYEAPLRWAIATGQLAIPRKADPETVFDVRIDGPSMPVIDPVKDRQAFESDQLNGWDSRHGIIRRMGRSPMDVDAERAQDTMMPAEQMQTAEPQPEPADEQEDGIE